MNLYAFFFIAAVRVISPVVYENRNRFVCYWLIFIYGPRPMMCNMFRWVFLWWPMVENIRIIYERVYVKCPFNCDVSQWMAWVRCNSPKPWCGMMLNKRWQPVNLLKRKMGHRSTGFVYMSFMRAYIICICVCVCRCGLWMCRNCAGWLLSCAITNSQLQHWIR